MNTTLISKIHSLPILGLDSGNELGRVVSWLVKGSDQKLFALVISSGWVLPRRQYLLTTDIVEYDNKMVMVRDASCLILEEEVVELKKLIEENSTVTDFKATSQQGVVLGSVLDFSFDKISSQILSYTVGNKLKARAIYPSARVVAILEHEVVFEDNTRGLPSRTEESVQPALNDLN